MPKPWELAQRKWNLWKSNSHRRKVILKKIGLEQHHAARAFGFLPFHVKQALTKEYINSEFEYSINKEAA